MTITALGLLFACAGSSPAPEAAPAPAPLPDKQTETLSTRDGVELQADIYGVSATSAPGVVLLHMIPPHWDRSSWPDTFITSLRERGWMVCVPDRRGAGESGGVAEEAYTGEHGRYDVEACVKRLQADGLGKLGIVGASNGTTSMIDYAVWAGSQDLPEPVVLGFMTGGPYTENQTTMAEVQRFPAVFTFSTEEREWSAKQQGGSWQQFEYPGGDHGTKMFAVKPEVADAVLGVLAERLR